jgi:hypothetical protein
MKEWEQDEIESLTARLDRLHGCLAEVNRALDAVVHDISILASGATGTESPLSSVARTEEAT